jgi:hypothetical protein
VFETDVLVPSTAVKLSKKSNLTLEEGPIGIPETPVSKHFTLCPKPKETRINFNRGGSLETYEFDVSSGIFIQSAIISSFTVLQ